MLAVVSTPEMHFCFINKRNHDDDDDDYNFNMHCNCDSDDDKLMNPSHNSGRDVHDNNVRNVGNIFVSFHADDVVILCFLRMLLLIKRVIVACTMEAMMTSLLLFVMVIMSFMLQLFISMLILHCFEVCFLVAVVHIVDEL